MAASLLGFWRHCYGADGQGGAVAAALAAARHTLHQLTAVPLPAAPPAASGAGWCEALFKEQDAISSALLVKTFMELQQRAAVPLTTEPAMPNGSEPAAAAAAENDESVQAPAKVTALCLDAQQRLHACAAW